MLRELEIVKEFIEEAKAQYPDARLYNDGKIQYCNGNDGTDFDFDVNDHLCEFGCGVEDNSVWAIKCLINRGGSGVIYCYPNGEMSPVAKIERDNLLTTSEVHRLYHHMLESYDGNGYFDRFIDDVEREIDYDE